MILGFFRISHQMKKMSPVTMVDLNLGFEMPYILYTIKLSQLTSLRERSAETFRQSSSMLTTSWRTLPPLCPSLGGPWNHAKTVVKARGHIIAWPKQMIAPKENGLFLIHHSSSGWCINIYNSWQYGSGFSGNSVAMNGATNDCFANMFQ